MEKLGEQEVEKEEPAKEGRREYTDLKEKNKHVACEFSDLASVMTDEAIRLLLTASSTSADSQA